MDLDPAVYKQILETFESELDEQLQILTDELLFLEHSPNATDLEARLNIVFRAAHNIKGSARSIGIEDIAEIAHGLEDIFNLCRQKKAAPNTNAIDGCLKAIDEMKRVLILFLQNPSIKTYDKMPILNHLKQLVESSEVMNPPRVAEQAVQQRVVSKDNVGVLEESKLTEVKRKPSLKRAEKQKPVDSIPKRAEEPAQPMSEADEPLKERSNEPEPAKNVTSVDATDYIKITTQKITEFSALADELQTTALEIGDVLDTMSACRSKLEQGKELAWQFRNLKKKRMAMDEEVVQAFAHQFSDLFTEMKSHIDLVYQDFRTSQNQLKYNVTALQDKTRTMRMVPLYVIFQPLQRLARDLAKELDKKVELSIQGESIEMDRAVLDLARDPLNHLVRNAIDHGIESPKERVKFGKPEVGHISIAARVEGNQICITVSDDGHGVPFEKVLDAAIRKRLIAPEKKGHMTKEEIIDLAFSPGVTSKEIITNLSGRGVGLDIVRTNIQAAKGRVTLDSNENQGTTVQINLPLTMITDRGMLIHVFGETFVIPTIAIHHVLEVDRKEIHTVESGQVIMFQEKPVPLRDLGKLLGLSSESTEESQKVPIVVVAKGWTLVAFIVDEILGEREIVIKKLQPPLISVHNVSGATLIDKGHIVIVLNPVDLVNSAQQFSARTRLSHHGSKEQKVIPRILVVDDSITTRTLESNILTAKGFQITTAVNGKEAWGLVQKQPFDLVVTDVMMPEMDGFELTQKIKSSDKYKKIPVIIVTSKATDEDKRRGVEVGADAYIVKSQFESQILVEVVEQLL